MPQVRYTAAKGLVQHTGTGFCAMDYLMRNEVNLSTTGAIEVTDAEARADQASSSAATKLACTLAPYKLNTTTFDGATGVGHVYLPAADEGVHLALQISAANGGANNLKIFLQGSAVEAARVTAGGTAATFVAGPYRVDNFIVGQGSTTPIVATDSHLSVELALDATNNSFEQNSVIHFYCPAPGKWIFAVNGISQGNGSGTPFVFA